jgi:hypothetical protein
MIPRVNSERKPRGALCARRLVLLAGNVEPSANDVEIRGMNRR